MSENNIEFERKVPDEAQWYVVHTYSGYEAKVKASIENAIENRHLEDFIFDIAIPMEEVVEIKDGKRKASMKKLFPGYILVHMIMNNETWYVVRNVRGVTGFVGPESEPVALTPAEMETMGMNRTATEINFEVGNHVSVLSGPFADFVGVIKKISSDKKLITVGISMFGRETPIDLEPTQIQLSKDQQ